ncbi:S-adenosyl-L-methionine-dependent methyltransferase [Pleurostoma richardsiae]|uniref:S-adenosyl-L-methionine-dependent methyltransferase n=1 Tax=Pleurostoma richardsiae TaxID=41990 RepID=A0AA38RSJ2_9PEZI|nr:S-adenosyl-L-methionine-dependent methyltransferase [Pleurostoma richardsiae]
MDNPTISNCRGQVDRFCRQYFQLEQQLDYPDGQFLREHDIQEELYARLFCQPDRASQAALVYLPPPRYRLRTLKELVARIESAIEDWDQYGISDNLMSSLAAMLAAPLPSETAAAQQKCYVTYHLPTLQQDLVLRCPTIALLESRALISAAGTTGLRTWEAALHLGRYLCSRSDSVRGKRVLELGAGTGYLSILCAKYLGAAQAIASDGSDDVVNNLPDNFFLNGFQGTDLVKPLDLKWGHALVGTEEKDWNGGRIVDAVIGADITYDSSIIPALVATLEELAVLFPRVEIIIAATERNRATFETFQTVCHKVGFTIEPVAFPVPARENQEGPFYNDQPPIHICHLWHTFDGISK